MKHDQLTFGNSLNVLGQLLGKTAIEYLFRFFIPKAPDHEPILTQKDNIVKGYYSGFGPIGNEFSKLRYSNRKLARNASMSLIGGATEGDSNSFDGGETEFTGEEHRVSGAP